MLLVIIVQGVIIAWPESELEQKPTAVIAGCMVDVGEYTFQKYHYTYVDEFKDPRKVFDVKIPLTTKSFVYAIPGTISYGFDMTEIKEDDIKVNIVTKKVTINMPEMFILSHEQDAEDVKIYAEDNNILNLIKTEDFQNVLVKTKKATEQDDLDRGVIEETKANAASMIKTIINVLPEYSEYDVELKFVEQENIRNINEVVTESE